ncbi:MAG: hypothetical protein AUF79_07700 [Crenarchaeota archaeon 13_1_20CM_2_51_8]|nr:MAG: hypothetical protein AUJ07_02115 [Crenarchaeota archaeon 13_1_40CM_3_53_5]OLE90916.1 MAG: hypothetical protein AUF79_07700 [Crenarchaeota archaeon 13_1_20CM_2_51_8]
MLRATLLIATFLIAIPIMPAWATPSTAISLVPSPSNPDIGDTFTLGVTPSAGFGIVGYDLVVNFDPSVFTAVGVSDPTLPTMPPGSPTYNFRTDILNPLGEVRVATVVLGGGCWATDGSHSLFGVQLQASGSSASAFPSAISVTGRLVGDATTCGISPLDFTSTPFSYSPPSDLGLRSVGCRADNDGFNTLAKGNSDPLFCRVINTSGNTITASTSFSYRSVGGVTGSVTGSVVTLGPGQAMELRGANLVVPSTNDIYAVTGTATRLITMGDGSVLTVNGPSDTFKVVVNT